jgi:glycosyltransferase involved in cell wall biosynthesis
MNRNTIKVAIDIRDLQIAASGSRSYLESLLYEFKKGKFGFEFYYIETKQKAYTGNSFLNKLKEQLAYFFWKQIQLPIKARQLGCSVLFCSDFMVPYFTLGIKTIPVFHDAFFWEYPHHYNKYWLAVFKKIGIAAAKKSPLVVTPTAYTKNQLTRFTTIKSDKMIVVGEGPKTLSKEVDSTNKSTSDSIVANTGPVVEKIIQQSYILHVGTFEKRKNLPALIRAFNKVQQNGFAHLKLVLVGKASNKITLDNSVEVQNTIEELGLEQEVIITGYLTDQAVEKIYQHAKLYVFPSVNEGFGIPVLEAFKYRVPLLVANNTCLPEVAGNGAISFDPYNVDEIAHKILQMLNDEDLQKQCIENGTARLQKYTWEQTSTDLLELFNKVVSGEKEANF